MAENKTGISELIWLNRLKQVNLEAQAGPVNGFSEVSQGDSCPQGCACLPWDYCDCSCHRFVPTKRRPVEQTPVS